MPGRWFCAQLLWLYGADVFWRRTCFRLRVFGHSSLGISLKNGKSPLLAEAENAYMWYNFHLLSLFGYGVFNWRFFCLATNMKILFLYVFHDFILKNPWLLISLQCSCLLMMHVLQPTGVLWLESVSVLAECREWVACGNKNAYNRYKFYLPSLFGLWCIYLAFLMFGREHENSDCLYVLLL